MFESANLEELQERGLIGATACNASGSIIDATSDDLEVFGSILGYISQVADMIGEPFGVNDTCILDKRAIYYTTHYRTSFWMTS